MDQSLRQFERHAPGENGRAPKNETRSNHEVKSPDVAASGSLPFLVVTPSVDQTPADSPTPSAAPRCGPPLLFDDAKRLQYCNLLHFGLTKGKAARIVGVSPRTVQDAVKKDPELAERVRQARLASQSRAACQIAMAGEKSWRAAAWLLEQGRRRRGPGRPRRTPRPLSDPLARDDMKKLVRDILLEMIPELRQPVRAENQSSTGANADAEAFADQSDPRLAAMVAEAASIFQRGGTPDLGALWREHLADDVQTNAHPNAQQCRDANSHSPPQTGAPLQLATSVPVDCLPITAQNP